jgi:hypothetical protein
MTGIIVNRAIFCTKDTQLSNIDFNHELKEETEYPFILSLQQGKTERIFAEILQKFGIKVERPVKLKSFVQDRGINKNTF